MSSESTVKRAAGESDDRKPDKVKRIVVEDDFDADLSSDIKGNFAALQQIKEKAQKDGQKKNEETISSVSSGIKSNIDELKTKLEKDRQNFAKALLKSSKECENRLKNEATKFQSLYENFCKEKPTHLQALKGGLIQQMSFPMMRGKESGKKSGLQTQVLQLFYATGGCSKSEIPNF